MNSKIILAKNINLDRQYTNVLDYSETQMLTLCQSQEHLVAQANDYSFIRTTKSIKTAFTYSQCLQANYIAFQNPDYDNKWFFAWVDDVIYKGNNNTEITYTIDAWSTWYDKWTTNTCYVLREHTNNDAVGLNTQPEGLETGEYIIDNLDKVNELLSMRYVLRVSKYVSAGASVPLATNYGGVYCAGRCLCI